MRLGTSVAALVLGMMVAAPAFAESSGACREDIAKYCADVKGGRGRIIACLKANHDRLSPGCQAAGAELKKTVAEGRAACETDIKTYCQDIKPGGGRIIACLKSNKDRLSQPCKDFAVKQKHKHDA